MKLKNTLPALSASLLAVSIAQAETVSFGGLNSNLASASNTLSSGLFDTADAELSVSGAASGNNYIYSITYSGQSFDGDAINDTLSFDVLVEGWTGSSASTTFTSTDVDTNAFNGSATIGTTDAQVDLSFNRFSVDNATMDPGKTLAFTLQNFNVATSQGSYTASLDSFTGAVYQETGAGYGHQAVIGLGSDLFASRFDSTNYSIAGQLDEGNPLYITSAAIPEGVNTANPHRFAIRELNFDVTVIPEPSSFSLIAGLLCLISIASRRR